jgi:hypothetical protein
MDIGTTCWMGTCGDVGQPTPDDQLPVLGMTMAGAPLFVELSDHSGLATWRVTARRAGAPGAATVVLTEDRLGATRVRIVSPGPPPGDWVVEAQVGFDLERGATHAAAVVRAP